MSTVPSTEPVPASDLRPGDTILYAGLKFTVTATGAATWVEGGEHVYGREIECRDRSGNARLFLYRQRHQTLERLRDE